MATTSADLETLVSLYNTLKSNVDLAHEVHTSTDSALGNAVWESPDKPRDIFDA